MFVASLGLLFCMYILLFHGIWEGAAVKKVPSTILNLRIYFEKFEMEQVFLR